MRYRFVGEYFKNIFLFACVNEFGERNIQIDREKRNEPKIMLDVTLGQFLSCIRRLKEGNCIARYLSLIASVLLLFRGMHTVFAWRD